MTPWPFGDLVPLHYRLLLVDPPWRFDNWSAAGELKNPVGHYRCEVTARLAELPVDQLAAGDGAVIVMWATAPMLDQAFELLKAWRFGFVTAGAWAKLSRTGDKIAFGTGYVYRSACEFWLVGRIGKPPLLKGPGARSVRNLIVPEDIGGLAEWAIAAPLREHSRKPDAMYGAIETLFPGPYAELFARTRRPNWDSWGDQADRFAGAAA